jgi:hypothetical protein
MGVHVPAKPDVPDIGIGLTTIPEAGKVPPDTSTTGAPDILDWYDRPEGQSSINDLIRLNLLKLTTTNLLKSARSPAVYNIANYPNITI